MAKVARPLDSTFRTSVLRYLSGVNHAPVSRFFCAYLTATAFFSRKPSVFLTSPCCMLATKRGLMSLFNDCVSTVEIMLCRAKNSRVITNVKLAELWNEVMQTNSIVMPRFCPRELGKLRTRN